MTREQRIQKILERVPELSDFSLQLICDIVTSFQGPKDFKRLDSSELISEQILADFGDVLRLHHSLSREPFSKDKFEYALESVLKASGLSADLAPRGQRGFDITIQGERFSLKTEAAKAIKEDTIHISKFMELGSGDWGSSPGDLEGLRSQFLLTLGGIKRIFILRALEKEAPIYKYELVEIPKALLAKAKNGRLEMQLKSKQTPKPGYCYVEAKDEKMFSLYFDGGSERKLQIKHLKKSLCVVHATWSFELPDHSR